MSLVRKANQGQVVKNTSCSTTGKRKLQDSPGLSSKCQTVHGRTSTLSAFLSTTVKASHHTVTPARLDSPRVPYSRGCSFPCSVCRAGLQATPTSTSPTLFVLWNCGFIPHSIALNTSYPLRSLGCSANHPPPPNSNLFRTTRNFLPHLQCGSREEQNAQGQPYQTSGTPEGALLPA